MLRIDFRRGAPMTDVQGEDTTFLNLGVIDTLLVLLLLITMLRKLWSCSRRRRKDQEDHVCLCYGLHEESECRIPKINSNDEPKENMFVTLEELRDALSETEMQKAQINRQTDNWRNKVVGKWNPVEGCELYYIFVYDEDGIRLPEHDTIAPHDHSRHDFKNIPNMDVMVLPLFRTQAQHGFVEIVKVRGLKDYDLVVDLSTIKNKRRESSRPSPTRFGFLCSSNNTYMDVKRVAAKRKNIESVSKEKRQIDLALDGGGQHNAKYLACTKMTDYSAIAWIAMDPLIKTFDILIEEKTSDTSYLIDAKKMKSCFRQILLGLIHLHSKGIIHGDIKLTNVLLSLDGNYLKIGEYDNVSQNENDKPTQTKDIEMCSSMFLQCLKRDSKYNPTNSLSRLCDPPTDVSMIERWIKKLTEFARTEQVTFMSAYFIVHAAMEKPEGEELLQHPYFWNDLKTLDFITRMDAWFYDPLHSDRPLSPAVIKELTNSASQEFKGEFRNACKILWSDLNWIAKLENVKTDDSEIRDNIVSFVKSKNEKKKKRELINALILKERCDQEVKDALQTAVNGLYGDAKKMPIADIEETLRLKSNPNMNTNGLATKIANEAKDYNPFDITRFLRLIRNNYAHYHEPIIGEYGNSVVRNVKFKSAGDLLEFFDNVLPEMIAVLHRVAWHRTKSRNNLPDDIRQFFSDPNDADKLELREEGEEIPMNYYDKILHQRERSDPGRLSTF